MGASFGPGSRPSDGTSLFGEFPPVGFDPSRAHQSQLHPADNKFHTGNGSDGLHYWLTPPALYAALDAEFAFDFDPCPYPLPEGFDGLTCEWGQSNYVNPPFGSIIHQGKKKGPTAWVRKAILEWQKGKRVVLVYPVDKWVLMILTAILGDHAQVRNLGDVKWLATEDRSAGKGTGRHIACFILEPCDSASGPEGENSRSEVEAESPQSGGAAASPMTASDALTLAYRIPNRNGSSLSRSARGRPAADLGGAAIPFLSSHDEDD